MPVRGYPFKINYLLAGMTLIPNGLSIVSLRCAGYKCEKVVFFGVLADGSSGQPADR